ncbi:MAG TPA: type II toxin-antitoxin system prevent-host-death family antitoxin [Gammaproteobacteria bacterium]|jgi:prevent-host-death family protein|nr:type II toxin-antitoxin system prevent-host-death family antitoxin [Gammaproteobacteria bacterium]
MTTSVSTIDAKEMLSELVNRVSHHKERVVLTRRGKEIAALISMEDLQLLISYQQKIDLEAAREALKEARDQGTISFNDLKQTTTQTPYVVKIAPRAEREFRALPDKDQKNIIKLIEALGINPRPPGANKIEGLTGLYCEETNSYRLIYKVEEQELLLLFMR